LLTGGNVSVKADKNDFADVLSRLHGAGSFRSGALNFDIDVRTTAAGYAGYVQFTDAGYSYTLDSTSIANIKSGSVVTVTGACMVNGVDGYTFQVDWDTTKLKLHLRTFDSTGKQIHDSKPTALSDGTLGVSQPTSSVNKFNNTAITAGNYLWFSSVLQVSGLPTNATTTILFLNQTITVGNWTVAVPNASVTYHPGTGTAKTVFTSVGEWKTDIYIGSGLSGNQFLSGVAFKLPSNLPGGVQNVVWSGSLFANRPVSVNWKWGAAVYSALPVLNPSQPAYVDYNSMRVKPVDDSKTSDYLNGDKAGALEAAALLLSDGTTTSIKSKLLAGGTGGGGSNYTGSPNGGTSALPAWVLDAFFAELDPLYGML
jgi:hypothetical protein